MFPISSLIERFQSSRGSLVSKMTMAFDLSTLSALLKSFRENSPERGALWFSTWKFDFSLMTDQYGFIVTVLVTFLGVRRDLGGWRVDSVVEKRK